MHLLANNDHWASQKGQEPKSEPSIKQSTVHLNWNLNHLEAPTKVYIEIHLRNPNNYFFDWGHGVELQFEVLSIITMLMEENWKFCNPITIDQ